MTQLVKDAYENLLLELYPESSLPFCWQVIYQEGSRKNHILFCNEDLQKFEDSSRKDLGSIYTERGDHIVELVSRILGLGIYTEIRQAIAKQPYMIRLAIFRVYLKILAAWTLSHRQRLH